MGKRKKPYVAGIAQINFKPQYDWEKNEARQLYENSNYTVKKDEILYEDCIEGNSHLAFEYFLFRIIEIYS